MKNDNVKLDRVSLNLETNIKSWYTDRAAVYGMAMGAYMQYVLVQFYEQQMNQEAVRSLSALNKDDELKEINKNLVELLQIFAEMNAENDGENQTAEQAETLS